METAHWNSFEEMYRFMRKGAEEPKEYKPEEEKPEEKPKKRRKKDEVLQAD